MRPCCVLPLRRRSLLLLSAMLLTTAAWFAVEAEDQVAATPANISWVEVAADVYCSKDEPHIVLVRQEKSAYLIDAAYFVARVPELGVEKIDGVLLTHHHRDSVAAVERYLSAGISVRAPKASQPWLSPAGVRDYWQKSIPLRSSNTAYFVVSEGFAGVACNLTPGERLSFGTWSIEVLPTPGHSRDHTAYVLRKGQDRPIVCSGDAIYSGGALWTPFTTDWDHWTDAGLKPAAESLRTLAALDPKVLIPAHGPIIADDPKGVLERAAAKVAEVGFLRSFERYTDRLGNAPEYPFLVPKEQIASAGDKPWARVSANLFITGNTYVLRSPSSNNYLVVDPWGQRSVEQVQKLRDEQKLGNLEVVIFSHAHYDHFDGVYLLPNRTDFQVWALDRVAEPLRAPFRFRAPFLDPRPIEFDRLLKDGESLTWREYSLKFHFLPGQTEFSSGIETIIDGKRCVFTADNFFHQRQFSGSGGWMGLNRSLPGPYAESARKVSALRPDWILAEHGGPYVFHADDYVRRARWGDDSAKAADAISVGGDHQRAWNLHRVSSEPLLQKVEPGGIVHGTLLVANSSLRPETVRVTLLGRGLLPDASWELTIPAKQTVRREWSGRLSENAPSGRHVFVLQTVDSSGTEPVDAFLAVDVP